MILLMVDDEPIIIQTLARSISIESLNLYYSRLRRESG